MKPRQTLLILIVLGMAAVAALLLWKKRGDRPLFPGADLGVVPVEHLSPAPRLGAPVQDGLTVLRSELVPPRRDLAPAPPLPPEAPVSAPMNKQGTLVPPRNLPPAPPLPPGIGDPF